MDSTLTRQYNDTLSALGLSQLVTTPTRVSPTSCTLIDHVITSNSELITNVTVQNSAGLSDHELVVFSIAVESPKFQHEFRTSRNFKYFNKDLFTADLINSNLDKILYIKSIDLMILIMCFYQYLMCMPLLRPTELLNLLRLG